MPNNEKTNRKLYLDFNLQIVFAITLMAVMGVASITPVFPEIKEVFDISSKKVGWLITAFTLPGVILTPVLGVLADRFGRKKILVPSLLLFGIAGMSCGFMREYNWLIIMRFVQGIGAAAIGSINVTLIGDLYSGRDRSAAMGYNASILSVGTALYPAIGGALAMIGWYFPFFFPVLAIPVGFIVLFKLQNPEPDEQQKFGQYFRKTLSFLNHKRVIGLMLISILTFIILYGSFLTFLPLLMGDRFGGKAYEIGIILSFSSISTAITSSQLGKISRLFSNRELLSGAYLLYILSMVLVPFLPNLWLMLIPAAIFGVAQGINIPGVQSMLAGSAPLDVRAAFMSISGWVLRIGQTLGPIVAGYAYSVFNLDATFYTGAAMAVLMLLIVITMIRK